MSRAVIFWLGILMVFAGGTIIWFGTKYASRQVGSETVVDQDADLAPKMTSFELIDQTGSRLKSEDLDGEVWAGSIFFASCPSTCYTQNVRLQQLDAEFGERGLKLISVTCDPSNDTPAALAAYALGSSRAPWWPVAASLHRSDCSGSQTAGAQPGAAPRSRTRVRCATARIASR